MELVDYSFKYQSHRYLKWIYEQMLLYIEISLGSSVFDYQSFISEFMHGNLETYLIQLCNYSLFPRCFFQIHHISWSLLSIWQNGRAC